MSTLKSTNRPLCRKNSILAEVCLGAKEGTTYKRWKTDLCLCLGANCAKNVHLAPKRIAFSTKTHCI